VFFRETETVFQIFPMVSQTTAEPNTLNRRFRTISVFTVDWIVAVFKNAVAAVASQPTGYSGYSQGRHVPGGGKI